MAATRTTLIRGALVGGAIGVPMGIGAGIFFAHMLLGETWSGRGVAFIGLVVLSFVAWAAFLGAMLNLQAKDPS